MAVTIPDFWKLVVESRLLSAEQCQKLAADFTHVKGAADQGNAKTLGEWLVARNALSRYQTMVLMAGRAGPFYYGDYRVYERVEQGAFKGQFRAIHAPTGHPTMLRFLTGSMVKDPREWAGAAARVVKQTGVVYPLLQRYFEPVDLQAFKFVVTEDLRGETLDELLAKSGRLHPVEACRIVRHAAFALAYLHQVGIIHGDVRPQHLLLEPSGNVKLLIDPTVPLGLVNVAQIDPQSPAAAKADYLAPDFLRAGKFPDELTDVYALGCTLYQLLTGQVPFPGGLPGQKLARHAAERIQPLEPYGIPQPLAQLVAYMMAKNSASRYQQASVVAEQLLPFIDPAHAQIPAASPPPTLAAYESWIKQKQAVLSTAATKPAAAPRVDVTAAAATGGAKATGPLLVTTDAAASTATARLQRKKKPNLPLIIGGGVGAALLLIVGLVIAMSGGDEPEDVIANKPPETPTNNTDPEPTKNTGNDKKQTKNITPPGEKEKKTDVPPVAPPVSAVEVRPDDGKLLWASPTAGKEITLENVPPDARILLVTRPAEILASSSGPQILEALGPQFVAQRAAWEKAAHVNLADVEQLVTALHDNQGKMPIPSYRVKLKTPIPEDKLTASWGNPAAKDVNGVRYYDSGTRAYFVPSEGGGSVFVMGNSQQIKEVAEAKGAPPVLQREINQLRQLSDADRHFTLIFAPKYLFGDGQELLTGPYQKLRSPLEWLIGEDVKATMTSMQFGETFYVEERMVADIDRRGALAGELRDRLEQVPTFIEKYMISLNAPEYWRMVAFRYPGWVRFLHKQMRVGLEDDTAIVNAVAPGPAAHNLVFGGELALMSTPGATSTAIAKPAEPKTIEDVLKHKMTFEVPRNDMNLVMADLEKEVKSDLPGLPFEFAIKIIGDDLKIEGITRNQAIVNFKAEGQTLAEILTGIARKANPVTTVKDPSEVDQKLVWLVGPDPDNPAKMIILVTTRVAAGTKNLKLPPVFVPK